MAPADWSGLAVLGVGKNSESTSGLRGEGEECDEFVMPVNGFGGGGGAGCHVFTLRIL